MNDEKILEACFRAVKKAGDYLRKNFGKARLIEEKSENDFVTSNDIRAEKMIKKILLAEFPHSKFVGEETSREKNMEGFVWLVDPLDGTNNYIKGFPFVCVSVACMIDGEVRVGVVYDFIRDEIFHALKGKGAFMNRRRIKVSKRTSLSGAMIATGFPFRSKNLLEPYLESFRNVFRVAGNIRRAGSAALDLCYTGWGKFDGFWEIGLNPWDIAAGSLILKEAGGVVTDFEGGEDYLWSGNIIGSSDKIYEEFFKLINSALGGGRIK